MLPDPNRPDSDPADQNSQTPPYLQVPQGAEEAFAVVERYVHPSPLLIVISGPSGVGKDSVIRRMCELRSRPLESGGPSAGRATRERDFYFVVTMTDRCPRPGEVDGVDYHFVSTAEFEEMIAQDELFEYAHVYGQYKGVPKAQIRKALASGLDVVMRLDVQGAETVRTRVPGTLTIFVTAPSIDVLISRLRRRAGDSAEQLQRRLQTALQEMERIHEFEYVVVNREGHLDETIRKIDSIIEANKCSTHRRQIIL